MAYSFVLVAKGYIMCVKKGKEHLLIMLIHLPLQVSSEVLAQG